MKNTHVISGDMRVMEIIALFPEAAEIMAEYGLHCFSCSIGGVETLEEGCGMHGMSDELMEELIDDLNIAYAEAPKRPEELTITPPAARGIKEIAEGEGRVDQVLRVEIDASGQFCLEFRDDVPEGEKEFVCDEEPDVRVCASALTLQRIGGAVIDMEEGRFKLDLPEVGCCKDAEEGCRCFENRQKV